MIEILILISALGAIGVRARQRGLSKLPYILVALSGWILLWFVGNMFLGFSGLVLRWLWVGATYLYIERLTRSGAKVEDRWECPECRMFNDGNTLQCLCGYAHPDAAGSPVEGGGPAV